MLKQLDEYRYLIPTEYKKGMRIEGLIYANKKLITQIEKDQTKDQVANVATLQGLVGKSLAMPDAHQGYGFCIGGVAAADPDDGIVSAGGVGFDINCGVRLLATELDLTSIRPLLDQLINQLFREIPCGAGKKGMLNLTTSSLDDILVEGAQWAIRQGYGLDEDVERMEDGGQIVNAGASEVSNRAKERGRHQLGTLGSGNHFLEIQFIEEVYDQEVASIFGVRRNQVVILLHSGSRGLGHQVCTDYLDAMQGGMKRYGISVIDRQLACVPIGSDEGRAYLRAMGAAANYAFANRQLMTHVVREVFRKITGGAAPRIVYDVCHNIAKFEEHDIDGKKKRVLVHRKGATRAFPSGHPALPGKFRVSGQPVLVPGSMGTHSYILVGTERAMKETYGSCCHGAGRAMSRTQAKRETTADELLREMKQKGIIVRGETRSGLTEEKPDAYKDVDEVIDVVHGAGIARKVARMTPLAVIKG